LGSYFKFFTLKSKLSSFSTILIDFIQQLYLYNMQCVNNFQSELRNQCERTCNWLCDVQGIPVHIHQYPSSLLNRKFCPIPFDHLGVLKFTLAILVRTRLSLCKTVNCIRVIVSCYLPEHKFNDPAHFPEPLQGHELQCLQLLNEHQQ